MATSKWDHKTGRDLYVVHGQGIREIARTMAVSPSSISAVAAKEDWKGQKMVYESSVARRSYENMASSVADEKGEILKENVLAARATIRKYLVDLSAGKVSVTARDAELMMRFLVTELNPADGIKYDDPSVKNVTPPDGEFLKRLIEAARGKVAAAPTTSEGLKVH